MSQDFPMYYNPKTDTIIDSDELKALRSENERLARENGENKEKLARIDRLVKTSIAAGNLTAIAYHVRQGETFGGLDPEALAKLLDYVAERLVTIGKLVEEK